jgi:hypothetical protein
MTKPIPRSVKLNMTPEALERREEYLRTHGERLMQARSVGYAQREGLKKVLTYRNAGIPHPGGSHVMPLDKGLKHLNWTGKQ